MSWDLVIFDCDGVLVDSEPASNRIMKQMLEEIGLVLTLDETVREFVGRTMGSCLKVIERRLGRAAPPDFEQRFDRKVFEAFREELHPIEGIAEALARIRSPYCVASSGSQLKMRTTLGMTDLLPLFDGRLFSATEVRRGKPHPDLFLHAADRMSAEPSRCAVVEDSPRGAQAGVAARMAVFGYAARTSPADLEAAGARCFSEMKQLPALLEMR